MPGEGGRGEGRGEGKIKPIGTVSNKRLQQICHTISFLIKLNGLVERDIKETTESNTSELWKYLEITLIVHLSLLYLTKGREIYFHSHPKLFFKYSYVKQTELLQNSFDFLQLSFMFSLLNLFKK